MSRGRTWALGMGMLLAVCLVKLGNPVILDHLIARPETISAWLWQPWPVVSGYGLTMLGIGIGALTGVFRGSRLVRWWWIPLVWLGWQLAASVGTVDARLTGLVLPQFLFCVVWFYVGLTVLRRHRAVFLVPVLAGFAWVVWVALDQHYGGLEATRKLVQSEPGWENLPPELLKRIEGNRAFGTLFYPNALAGMVLLLLPVLGVLTWQFLERAPRLLRLALTGTVAYLGAAALYWSGSKAGWLIGAGVAAVAVLQAPMSRKWRVGLAVGIGVAMACLFVWRFQGYLERGATSAAARVDYWRAGLKIVSGNPFLGTGPGTFGVLYPKFKAPEAEKTRLAHNDYLQQATDSGIPGMIAYMAWALWILAGRYRQNRIQPLALGVWLGLLGWFVQGGVEFGLYIPALSWLAFAMAGWWCAGTCLSEGSGQGEGDRLASAP